MIDSDLNDLVGLRVIAVHAHPDDESITMAGTLNQLARRGAHVTVVTCTLGEEGEVIGEPFQLLVNDEADQLGGFRIAELTEALSLVGAHGEFLGDAGRFRDSGMVGSPAHDHPRAFVNSSQQAVDALAEVFSRLRPHLVLTYGPDGGYGHPDHIRAHEITHQAAGLIPVPRILWAVTDRAALTDALADVVEVPAGWRRADDDLAAVDHTDIAVPLDERAYATKVAALRAHATQVWVADGSVSRTNPHAARPVTRGRLTYYALSNLIIQPVLPHEYFQLGAGVPVPADTVDVTDGLTW